jgi:hypothetical protein
MELDEKKYLAMLEGMSIEDCKCLLFMQKVNYQALSNGDQRKFTPEQKHIRLNTLTYIIRKMQLLNTRIRKIEDAKATEILPTSFSKNREIDNDYDDHDVSITRKRVCRIDSRPEVGKT